MELFGFLKSKREQAIDFKNEIDLGKILNQGIYFEDTGQFLKWGTSLNDLAKEVPVKEKLFADRTVYNWGEHSILDGLKLEFTIIFWNHKDESRYKKFNAIEFWAVGNETAEEYLKVISAHIEKHYRAVYSHEPTHCAL